MQLEYVVKHSSFGRVRLAFLHKSLLPSVAALLEEQAGVLYVRTNPACASLIVRYDNELFSLLSLKKLLAAFFEERRAERKKQVSHEYGGSARLASQSGGIASQSGGIASQSGGIASQSGGIASQSGGIASLSGGIASQVASLTRSFFSVLLGQNKEQAQSASVLSAELARRDDCSCSLGEEYESVVAKRFGFFGLLSSVMGYVFFRSSILRLPLAQGLFSPLGVISVLAAVPLLVSSLRELSQRKFSLEIFLAAGCCAASAAGQALTALEILWIHSGADALSAWVSERSRKSISSILDIHTKSCYVLIDDVEVERPLDSIKLGDRLVLHTGERVCVDGTIVFGEALLDDSAITGRVELAHVKQGDYVYAGSYVYSGVVHVEVSCVGDATYLSRIMHLVEDSLQSKAEIEGLADRLALRMLRLGFAGTLLTLIFTANPWRAFTVMLLMACPCATTLSAQTAVSAAISAAARRGILIKGGRYLEEIGKATVFCFDKTGTLTSSQPRIERVLCLSSASEEEMFLWAYSAEMHNHHPLGKAIRAEAEARGIVALPHELCEFVLGRGVRAVIAGEEVRLGNRDYISELSVDFSALEDTLLPLREEGLTLVYLAKGTELLGVFAFANEARPWAKETVAALHADGVEQIVMITGDSEKTALHLQRELGVDICYHSVLPEEKKQIVKELQEEGRQVVMVGDGINDALALAEADIGIAMGAGGADIAIEAADIALVNDDLSDLLAVRSLSKKAIAIANQNFALASYTNIGGALGGALGLLSPVAAGFIHILHTVGVLANSSRLLYIDAADKSKK